MSLYHPPARVPVILGHGLGEIFSSPQRLGVDVPALLHRGSR